MLPVLTGIGALADESVSAHEQADLSEPTQRSYVLPMNSEIPLRLLDTVASNTHKRGDRFRIEVATAVMIEDQIVIPAGSIGEGEVIHAAKPGMAGRAGELILAARFLRVGEHEIKLKSFTAGTGEHRMNLANGLGVSVGIPGLFVVGKNIVIPAGSDVFAKVAKEVALPSFLGMRLADPAPPSLSFEIETEIDNDESAQH